MLEASALLLYTQKIANKVIQIDQPLVTSKSPNEIIHITLDIMHVSKTSQILQNGNHGLPFKGAQSNAMFLEEKLSWM